MIRGSDGLDYEDLAARLVGEPAKTRRNRILGGPSDREFKADYIETYDHYEASGYDPGVCHRSALAQASYLERVRARRLVAEHDDRLDASIQFANYVGKPGAGLTTGYFGVVTIGPDYAI